MVFCKTPIEGEELFLICRQKMSIMVNQIYIYIYIHICFYVCMCICIYNRLIGQVGRVFANGQRDLASIPDRVIPKTLKMALDTSLLNTQQYKVRIKGKVEQSRQRSSTFPYNSAIEKGAFWSPSTMAANFTYNTCIYWKKQDIIVYF